MAPMEYLGAWGTLIHEKNLKSKISCQTPFKEPWNQFPAWWAGMTTLFGTSPQGYIGWRN